MDFQSIWKSVTDANSLPFISAISGGFFGALGGFFIGLFGQRRLAFIAELNSVRTALTLSISVCSTHCVVKKQLIRPLHEGYVQHVQSLDRFLQQHAAGQMSAESRFQFQADLRSIPTIDLPYDLLRGLVLDKTSAPTRAVMAALDLAKTANILNLSIEQRNTLLQEMRAVQGDNQETFYLKYLAYPSPSGQVDARYKDIMNAVNSYNNDCIFYAHQLYDDLVKYGNKRRSKRFRLFASIRPLPVADWSKAVNDRLMPSNDDYAGWLSDFKEPTERFPWVRRLFGR